MLVVFLWIQPGFSESLKTSGWRYQKRHEWKKLLTEFGWHLGEFDGVGMEK